MRRDECMTIRADLIGEFPDGVPGWMVSLPDDRVRELMRLRRDGFVLLGLEPGDDVEDLFEDDD